MSFEGQVNAAIRAYRNQQGFQTLDPKVRAEAQRRISRSKEPQVVNNITLAKVGVLDRTVAGIRSGARSAPISQLNPEQRQQLLRAKLNDQAKKGSLSPEQYQEKLAEINRNYEIETGARTEYLGRIAAVKGRSETAKQDEARAIAGMQGVALGTIDKQGQASASVNSLQFANQQTSKFAEGQKNINKMQAEVLAQNGVKEKQNYAYSVSLSETLGISDSQKSERPIKVQGGKVIQTEEKLIGFTGMRQAIYEPGKIFITQDNTPFGPPKSKNTPLDEVTKFLGEKRDSPFLNFLGGVSEELFTIFSSGVNLEQKGGELFHNLFTSKRETIETKPRTSLSLDSPRALSAKENKVTETITGLGISGIGTGLYESALTGKGEKFTEALSNTYKKAEALVQTQGLARTGGQIVGFVLPIKSPTKVLPVGTQSFKALTESGAKTIVRDIEIGYGTKTRSIGGKTPGGFFLGDPTKESVLVKSGLGNIIAVDRGVEFSTTGKLGTKILTSDAGLKILQGSGRLLERDVEAVKLGKELAGLVQKSSKEVPMEIRTKATSLPDKPLTSVLAGKESKALNEEIMKMLPTKKGTLAETLQLDLDLIRTPKETREFVKQIGKSQDALSNLGVSKSQRESIFRSDTTGDLDVDFGHLFRGTARARKAAKKSVDIFTKVGEKDRSFYVQEKGTNVFGLTKGEEPKEILNILTKKDKKKGYLNEQSPKPFEINLGRKKVKVPLSEGSKEKTDFVTIEQQAMNRIESVLSLQGPSTDKFKGATKDIPYLTDAYKSKGVQTTEKGYTIMPSEHRLKDLSKLISQDAEQIARNFELIGKPKEAAKVRTIKERYIELYPEVDFKKFDFPQEFGIVDYSLSSVAFSKGKEASKDLAKAGLIQSTKDSKDITDPLNQKIENNKMLTNDKWIDIEKGFDYTDILTPDNKITKKNTWDFNLEDEINKINKQIETGKIEFKKERMLLGKESEYNFHDIIKIKTNKALIETKKDSKDIRNVIDSRSFSRNVIDSRSFSRNVIGSRSVIDSRSIQKITNSRSSFGQSRGSLGKPKYDSITGSFSKGSKGSTKFDSITGSASKGSKTKYDSITGSLGGGSSGSDGSTGSIGSPGSPGTGGSKGSGGSFAALGIKKEKSVLPPTRKVIPFGILNILNTTKKAPGKKERTFNFLGSSRVAEIVGFRTKTSDITVGDKLTRKLYDEDLKKTRNKFYGLTGKKKNIRL